MAETETRRPLADEVRDVLEARLPEILDAKDVEIAEMGLLAGGASKEAWSIDVATGGRTVELLLRREAGGAVYEGQLSIHDEYRVIREAFEAGVLVPRPYAYFDDVLGRDAFLMERLKGETFGRRIVRMPALQRARQLLPGQMAEQLARIHAIPLDRVDFLPGPAQGPATPSVLDYLEELADSLAEPHPAIELGIRWLRDNQPPSRGHTLIHADFRLGNLIVNERGLVAVLDWELTRRGEPAEDIGWSLIRAWRFGVDDKRVAGISDVEPYLERYNELTGRGVTLDDLFYWEVCGNVRWALGSARQALRHISGEEPSIELAVLGRLTAEVEYEILDMLSRAG